MKIFDEIYEELQNTDNNELNNLWKEAKLKGEKANNPEKMKDTFIKQFSKTGESDFYIIDIKHFFVNK